MLTSLSWNSLLHHTKDLAFSEWTSLSGRWGEGVTPQAADARIVSSTATTDMEVVLWGFRLYTVLCSQGWPWTFWSSCLCCFLNAGISDLYHNAWPRLYSFVDKDSNCDLSLEWVITERLAPLKYPEQWSPVTKQNHSKSSFKMGRGDESRAFHQRANESRNEWKLDRISQS